MPPRARKASGGEPLGFEDVLWKAADKLRGSMDASEYKHVVLGLKRRALLIRRDTTSGFNSAHVGWLEGMARAATDRTVTGTTQRYRLS